MHKIFAYLQKFDWILFSAVLLLMFFSLAEIYSITLSKNEDLLNFKKQILFVLIGLVLLFFLSFLDYHIWRNNAVFLYIIGAVLLIGVLVFGQNIRGTRGWFDLGFFNFQPVEFIKITTLIFLARYLSSHQINLNSFKHILTTGALVFLNIVLILMQPDFGSAAIIFILWLSLLVLAGVEKKYIIGLFLIFVMLFGLSWQFFLKDYQKQRILTLLNPSAYSLDEGYNVAQSIIAVGSGGIIGRGIGFGSQSQLKFLPEAQTDFIFAVIAEELGFLGVMLVLFFFTIIFLRIMLILGKINHDFGVYFVLGTLVLIFIQMFINIGMNIGIVPVVGISLPFLSYGGSALLAFLILIGISESIIIRSKLKY